MTGPGAAVKQGYGKYDEGLAIFSRRPIRETDFFTVSRQDAFDNWKTRKILGASVLLDGQTGWFYDVHLGWWEDEEEPSREQIKRLQGHIFCEPSDRKPVFPPGLCSCKIDYRISAGDDALPVREPQYFCWGISTVRRMCREKDML